jgi:hypothetical protein
MMIAELNSDDGKTRLLLGLSRENINRLISGMPMSLNQRKHGTVMPANLEIAIFFAEDEAAMKRILVAEGYINEKTEIRVDPRLKDL